MTDLSTRYLGLTLRSPIVASSSPLTGRLDRLLQLQQAGVGAVVLPSLFEEEVEDESMVMSSRLDAHAESFAEATTFMPAIDLTHVGPKRHVALVEEAKEALSVPVIASVNGVSAGGWLRYATALADAGADAIELNLYALHAEPTQSGAEAEDEQIRLVEGVRKTVDLPLAVKLSPFLSSTANFARRLVDAGADGLVVFNRLYQPDIDLTTLRVVSRLELSHLDDLQLPLRWVALLRPYLPEVSLGLTSGVHSGREVVKALLAGADVAMMASALLRRGASYVHRVESELRAWMDERGYDSVTQLRGSMSGSSAEEPDKYQRALYRATLDSYSASSL